MKGILIHRKSCVQFLSKELVHNRVWIFEFEKYILIKVRKRSELGHPSPLMFEAWVRHLGVSPEIYEA